MKNEMNIENYLRMANEKFSNIDADNLDLNFYGGGNLATPQYSDFSRGNYYSNANGGGNVVAAKQPTPYQVNVTNTSASAATVVLFGLNTYLLTANFGTTIGVSVTPAQSNVSYLELLQQSASQPFQTSLIRIQTSNPAQITQILTLTSKDANGQLCQIPIITQSYFSANQFQSTILDVPYPVKIDGNTYLTFPILGNTTATYTFFPAEKVNIARNLNDQSQQQVYANPSVPVAVPMFAPAASLGGGNLMIDAANR